MGCVVSTETCTLPAGGPGGATPPFGPDPECTQGHGEAALEAGGVLAVPRPTADHSRRTIRPRPVPVTIGPRPSYAAPAAPPTRAGDANPLAGLDVRPSPKTSC
jgi:hypothetical protein